MKSLKILIAWILIIIVKFFDFFDKMFNGLIDSEIEASEERRGVKGKDDI